MIVTESGRSGLTNAYTSVLSADGSWLIRGASRWLEAWLACGAGPRASATVTAAATPRTTRNARVHLCISSPSLGVVAAYSAQAPIRFEPAADPRRMTRDDRVSVERAPAARTSRYGPRSRS